MPVGVRLRIRGVVTLPSNLLDGATAVVQDPTGGILIRLTASAGALVLGQLVDLDGIRATRSGMLSLRVSRLPLQLGTQADPEPARRASGALGEAQEATLVVVRGGLVSSIARSSTGTLSFNLNDGSGPIRVTVAPKSSISLAGVKRGAWLEVRGVLGQETTAREPDRGFRIWLRGAADVTPLASAPSAPSPKPSPHRGTPGQLSPRPGAEGRPGASASGSVGTIPLVALALPTRPMDAAVIPAPAAPAAPDPDAPRAAALLSVSLGMAMIAGVLGIRGRRGTGEEPPVEGGETNHQVEHLWLVPIEMTDAPEERRILPPT